MANNSIKILWKKFIKCIKRISKNKNLLVDNKIKKKICFEFARYLSKLIKCIEKYNLFFHKLVYYMHYKEYLLILKIIDPVSSMRKNEIIVDLLALLYISKIRTLDDINNLWYFHLENMTEST